MKREQMQGKRRIAHWVGRLSIPVAVATLVIVSLGERAQAGPAGFKILRPEAGGLIPSPLITNLTKGADLTLNWTGFGGSYKVERADKLGGPWVQVGTTSDATTATVPTAGNMGFVRVQSTTPPNYVGADTCVGCHSGAHTSWSNTGHALALETLKAINQDKNPTCLKCHTVGFGFASGFKDELTTPQFAGVQCESCHGPGGAHAENPVALADRPVVTMTAKLCGGCHTDFHHPTYDEWEHSKHAEVTETTAHYFTDPNPATSAARILACGPCHSGTVRVTMVNNLTRSATKQKPMPSGVDAASEGVTCAVCHNPHGSVNAGNLRNPSKSLTPFSYSTATTTTFKAQYDANLNLCGQCHNSRGAKWTDTSRYPHYSPQYNLLVGSGGVEVGTVEQSKHRDNPNQCAGCHTHRHSPTTPSEEDPVYTGHSFAPTMESCRECHTAEDAAAKKLAVQSEVRQAMNGVTILLNAWATTKSNEALRKYGTLAWEFSTPGHLGNPSGSSTAVGPVAADQALIPDDIKQARYNLYLVDQDKSLGVHNAPYTRHLLKVAEDKVKAQLGQ